MTTLPATLSERPFRLPLQVGRMFVGPLFDYLVIGGGASILLIPLLLTKAAPTDAIPFLILVSNSAHFAASTVRLYTKPGAFREFPFLTLGLPLATIAAVTLTIANAPYAGHHLLALYLTWSPYHYAAQAYGLAVMYCYRSACTLDAGDRRLLRAACLSPFLAAFMSSPTVGIEWFVPASVLGIPAVFSARHLLVQALEVASFLLPCVWLFRVSRRNRAPVISLLVVVANGLWWIPFNYIHAFVWATIFHGLQYLAIVTIFHVKDHRHTPSEGWVYPAATFYAYCLLLGLLLFQAWPFAFVRIGFGVAESMLLVTAVINIHHFIVDAYIWRLRREGNYRIVTDVAPSVTA
jgi:hypothetical protein